MGQSHSAADRDLYKQLNHLLRSHNSNLPKKELRKLLEWILLKFPYAERSAVFCGDFWESVGHTLFNDISLRDPYACNLFPAYKVLAELCASQKPQIAAKPLPAVAQQSPPDCTPTPRCGDNASEAAGDSPVSERPALPAAAAAPLTCNPEPALAATSSPPNHSAGPASLPPGPPALPVPAMVATIAELLQNQTTAILQAQTQSMAILQTQFQASAAILQKLHTLASAATLPTHPEVPWSGERAGHAPALGWAAPTPGAAASPPRSPDPAPGAAAPLPRSPDPAPAAAAPLSRGPDPAPASTSSPSSAPDPAPAAAAPPVLPRDAPAPGAAPPLPARLLHSRPDPPADANPAPPPPHPPAAPQPLPLATEPRNPPTPAPLPGFPNPSSYPSTSLPSPDLQTATAPKATYTKNPSENASPPQVLLPTTSTPPAPLPQLAAAPASHTTSFSPHPDGDTMPRQGERNNVTAASTNKVQTENYVTPANSNLSIPVSPNSQQSASNLQLKNCPEIKYNSCKDNSLHPQALQVLHSQRTAVPSQEVKEVLPVLNDSAISFSYITPQLKTTIENTRQTLKRILLLKEGRVDQATPQKRLNKALYAHNFLSSSAGEPRLQIYRHFLNTKKVKIKGYPPALPKILNSGHIQSPHSLLTWGKGFSCVSTGGQLKLVPGKNVKPYHASKSADTPTPDSSSTSTSQEASTQT